MTPVDWSGFGPVGTAVDFPGDGAASDDPLVRLVDLADTATDAYATAIRDYVEADIEYRRAWDEAYMRAGSMTTNGKPASNAERERLADIAARGLWSVMRTAEAEEKAHDKRLRSVLARLSALQTVARAVERQS